MPVYTNLVVAFLLVSSVPLTWLERPEHHQRIARQTEDFNVGGLPSNLPSPPEHPPPKVHNEAHDPPPEDYYEIAHFEPYYPHDPYYEVPPFYYNYYYPYYYHTPVPPPYGPPMTHHHYHHEQTQQNDGEDPKEEEKEEDPPTPFGLNETILILVPQFKYTIEGFPKWAGASVRLSAAFTIFFDELNWPKTPPPPFIHDSFWGRLVFGQGRFPGGARGGKSVLSLPPPQTLVGGERALLIPKVEQILTRSGIVNSRACLLRSVCEVHAQQIERTYGFFGQVLKQVFSMSQSTYSATHLPSYLAAEEEGKKGNCSQYMEKCKQYSLFQ